MALEGFKLRRLNMTYQEEKLAIKAGYDEAKYQIATYGPRVLTVL